MSNDGKKLISACPICTGELQIARLACGSCGTQIDTRLGIPAAFRLPSELQEFVLIFLQCRGNIREVERVMGISYPTVCKKLDMVNALLGGGGAPAGKPLEVLERLERGEISAAEAARLLRGD